MAKPLINMADSVRQRLLEKSRNTGESFLSEEYDIEKAIAEWEICF